MTNSTQTLPHQCIAPNGKLLLATVSQFLHLTTGYTSANEHRYPDSRNADLPLQRLREASTCALESTYTPLTTKSRGCVEMTLRQTWSSRTWTAICVQRFDDSLNSAIHITYRSWLRSSSMHEPRDPPLEVVTFRFIESTSRFNT